MNIKYFLIVFVLCVPVLSWEGKVTLMSGEIYEGTFEGSTIYFKDIFRKERFRLRLKTVYRMDLLYESISHHISWSTRKEEQLQKYILSITTWDGERYWGRVRWGFKFEANRRRYKIAFPHKQYLDEKTEKYTAKQYATSLIFKSKLKQPPTNEDKLPALEGNIDKRLKGVFTDAYLVHYELGTLFKGSIYEEKYSFKNIFPGTYDLIFVGDKGIAFHLSQTKRTKILDQNTQSVETGLYSWIENFGDFERNLAVMFYVGHFSDTRVIIIEKTKTFFNYFLWGLKYNMSQKKWTIVNRTTLYSQSLQDNKPLPQLLMDTKLGNITVDFGKTVHNYIVNNDEQ